MNIQRMEQETYAALKIRSIHFYKNLNLIRIHGTHAFISSSRTVFEYGYGQEWEEKSKNLFLELILENNLKFFKEAADLENAVNQAKAHFYGHLDESGLRIINFLSSHGMDWKDLKISGYLFLAMRESKAFAEAAQIIINQLPEADQEQIKPEDKEENTFMIEIPGTKTGNEMVRIHMLSPEEQNLCFGPGTDAFKYFYLNLEKEWLNTLKEIKGDNATARCLFLELIDGYAAGVAKDILKQNVYNTKDSQEAADIAPLYAYARDLSRETWAKKLIKKDIG